MTELAFRVKPDSEFYQKYQNVLSERQRFVQLGNAFLGRCGLEFVKNYCVNQRLTVDLTQDQAEKLSGDLLKGRAHNGYYFFRKDSKYQKRWDEEVVSQVDFDLIYSMDLWYFAFIRTGKYSLWDYKGAVYGVLQGNNDEEIQTADWMDPIPMSEYYRVIEDMEAKRHG